jgi:hypothetical protein
MSEHGTPSRDRMVLECAQRYQTRAEQAGEDFDGAEIGARLAGAVDGAKRDNPA